MKAIKVAGKVIGWAVGGYAILNTLAWAVIGAGHGLSKLRDACDDDRIQDKIGYSIGRNYEEAIDGWKWWLFLVKVVIEDLVENIKDAF